MTATRTKGRQPVPAPGMVRGHGEGAGEPHAGGAYLGLALATSKLALQAGVYLKIGLMYQAAGDRARRDGSLAASARLYRSIECVGMVRLVEQLLGTAA